MAPIDLKKKQQQEEVDETKRVEQWRRFVIRDEMEKTGAVEIMADDIEALVRSKVSWEEIKLLRENGCPPDLIVKILT